MFLMLKQTILALTLIITTGVPATRATPLRWKIYNATFDDGGAITGASTFDADTTTLCNFTISTTAGTVLLGASYPVLPTTAGYQSSPDALFFWPQALNDRINSFVSISEKGNRSRDRTNSR